MLNEPDVEILDAISIEIIETIYAASDDGLKQKVILLSMAHEIINSRVRSAEVIQTLKIP